MITILATIIDGRAQIETACKPNRVDVLHVTPGYMDCHLVRIYVLEGQDPATVIKRCETQLYYFKGEVERDYTDAPA